MEGFRALNRERAPEIQASEPRSGERRHKSELSYLDRLVEEARQFKLSWHIINLGTYNNRETIEKGRAVMHELFGCNGGDVMDGMLSGMNEGIDAEALEKVIAKIQKLDYGYPIITVPVEKAEGIHKYYTDFSVSPRKQCVCPWVYVDIDYDGNAHFCVDHPEYSLGNITRFGPPRALQ